MENNNLPNSYEEAIETLSKIITELETRELTNNCIVEEFIGIGWNDLCDKGIKMFEYLKQDE